MSKTDVWMPLYIGEYLSDTMRLTTLQHGAYLLLLMEYWKSGPLPDDDAELAAIAKMDAKAWAKIAVSIRRFFAVGADGLLHQKRADAERAKASKIRAARRDAANQRWGAGDTDPDGSNGGAKPEQNLANGHATREQNTHETACKPDANALQEHMQKEMQEDVHARAAPQVTLLPRDSAAKPLDSTPRARPYVSTPFEADSQQKWRGYAERWEDGRPVIAGHYADLVEQAVLAAAKFDDTWNRDLRPLVAWLKAGVDPDLVIVPTIRRVAARGNYPTPPPTSLNYFDPMIRRQRIAA